MREQQTVALAGTEGDAAETVAFLFKQGTVSFENDEGVMH